MKNEDGPMDVYVGGAHREGNGDRPRFDLLWERGVPYEQQMLTRDAEWLRKGAQKYGERNWEAFATEDTLARCEAALGRHYAQWMAGDTSEDHAAAIRTNVQVAEAIKRKLRIEEPPS